MAREYSLNPAASQRPKLDHRAMLNEQQYAAVTAPAGQALVIAGAGSGKTRTLTHRVAWLLENGIAPERILLLTFTNKAAREMLERVESLVAVDVRRLWGGTFHSVGNRLLRLHGAALGLRQSFGILDREDQKDLLDAVLSDAESSVGSFRLPKAEVMGEIFSLASNTRLSTEEILTSRYPYFLEALEDIEAMRQRYEQKKRQTQSVDFDDLLALPLRLFEEHPQVLETLRSQFEFVLVDEFQDCCALQVEWLRHLVGPRGNLMVVGDDAQSIYSWRGAEVEHILNFGDLWPQARVFKIEINYRSVPEVLALANASIACNKGQVRKELRADRGAAGALPALVALDDGRAQAAFVAQRLGELHEDEGKAWSDMAVLYRAHFHSMELQMELTARGIPFEITSGLRFFEQAHVKDVAAFMKFAVNEHDEVSFLRMVRLVPGIGPGSATKLWTAWRKVDHPPQAGHPGTFSQWLLPMSVPKKAREGWQQLAYTLDELVIEGKAIAPTAMIRSVVEGVYEDYARSKFKNADQRQQDLDQLAAFAQRYEDCPEFLAQLSLLSGVDTGSSPEEGSRDVVTLSSAHQAKGLEWPVVFAISLAEGLFPHHRVLEDEASLEEERRLFYVTLTRARDELYLCHPLLNPQSRTGDVILRPSRFIQEVSQDLLEKWNIRPAW